MSNWSRKAKRKGVKHPKCCGQRMTWKDDYNVWICFNCGRKRHARKGTLKEGVQNE